MAKTNKVRADRVIVLVLLLLAICIGLGFGIYVVIDKIFTRQPSTNDNTTVIDDPKPVETIEGIKVELLDYQIYRDSENLGFGFVVANLQFTGENSISFDLGNLQTSEKIYLNNVSKYLNTLQEKSFNISKLELTNTIVSQDKQMTANIFVPYTTTSDSLRILNTEDKSMIQLNLDDESKFKDIATLKFETDQPIEVGDTNVTVSRSYISDMMIHNGVTYDNQALTVYTFKINVNKVDGDLKITDAKFVREKTDDVIDCMPEAYRSIEEENCLNKKLVEGENGALFFETRNEDNPDYSGYLMLMFSNSSEWVKIPTTLQ